MSRVQPRKQRNREYVRAYLKEHPCVDCGEDDIRVLTFDHRNPEEKSGTIGTMLTNGTALATIRNEIAKCDVRCCNCHRKKDITDYQWF